MLCLSASPQLIHRMIGRTMARKSLATAVSLALSVLGWCAATPTPSVAVHPAPLSQLEKKLRRVPAHISEFSPVSEPLALPKCGNTRPPEALLTPDPVLQGQDELNVRVSFIVGSDGRVFSPFILNSGTPDADRVVLHAVRAWRYRPALCNGVPTDSEVRVRFTVR